MPRTRALCLTLAFCGGVAGWAPPGPGSRRVTVLREEARALALVLALGTGLGQPVTAVAALEGAQRNGPVEVTVPRTFGFEEAAKPLKTHSQEFGPFSSQATKGFKYGVTVDPVRIDDLRNFGTPDEVLLKVTNVERNKDGTMDVTALGSTSVTKSATEANEAPFYELEYIVDSTRGLNHFWSSVTIQKGKLYVLTVQAKEATYGEVKDAAKGIMQSFRVLQQ